MKKTQITRIIFPKDLNSNITNCSIIIPIKPLSLTLSVKDNLENILKELLCKPKLILSKHESILNSLDWLNEIEIKRNFNIIIKDFLISISTDQVIKNYTSNLSNLNVNNLNDKVLNEKLLLLTTIDEVENNTNLTATAKTKIVKIELEKKLLNKYMEDFEIFIQKFSSSPVNLAPIFNSEGKIISRKSKITHLIFNYTITDFNPNLII